MTVPVVVVSPGAGLGVSLGVAVDVGLKTYSGLSVSILFGTTLLFTDATNYDTDYNYDVKFFSVIETRTKWTSTRGTSGHVGSSAAVVTGHSSG